MAMIPGANNISDTLGKDSVLLDTISEMASRQGIELINPAVSTTVSSSSSDSGLSWVFAVMIAVFCLIAFRFHNNKRFLKAFLRDLTETRIRNNVFDDTVRETFLVVLLNLQWIISAGVLIYFGLKHYCGTNPADSASIPEIPVAIGCALCSVAALGYELILWLAYYITGNVFSDDRHTRVWIKGFTASQSLCGVVFFILALLLLCYQSFATPILFVAICTFIITKIIFLWKGFRIFFTQKSSWILFLYYLCSLEIIPVILTLLGAWKLCNMY